MNEPYYKISKYLKCIPLAILPALIFSACQDDNKIDDYAQPIETVFTEADATVIPDELPKHIKGYYDAEEKYWVSEDPHYQTSSGYTDSPYCVISRIDDEGNTLGMGLVDTKGNIVVPPIYDGLSSGFTDGLCKVALGDKWGLFNEDGIEVVYPEYDDIWDEAEEGLIKVRKGEFVGFINTDGDVVIPIKYESAMVAGEGMIAFMHEPQRWGYINHKNEIVIPPEFTAPGTFENGKTTVQKPDGKEYTVYTDGSMADQ